MCSGKIRPSRTVRIQLFGVDYVYTVSRYIYPTHLSFFKFFVFDVFIYVIVGIFFWYNVRRFDITSHVDFLFHPRLLKIFLSFNV